MIFPGIRDNAVNKRDQISVPMEFKCFGKIIQSKGGMDGWLEEARNTITELEFHAPNWFWVSRILKEDHLLFFTTITQSLAHSRQLINVCQIMKSKKL